MNVLIIDDDPNATKILGKILKAKGFETEEASTGSEAMASIKAKFFNVVLIDIKLPDMSGLDFLKALRTINEETIAIMITGFASLDSSIEAMNNGAYAYITKPVNMDHTLIIIDKAIEKQRMDKALRDREELLNKMGRVAMIGGWSFNIKTLSLTWTDEVYRIHELDCSLKPTIEMGINFYAPSSRPIIEKAVNRAIKNDEGFDLELELVTAKGKHRFVRVIGNKARETNGSGKEVYGIIQDITELKKAQEIQCSLKARSDFISMVTHELRSPFGAIQMGLDYIFDEPTDNLNAKQLEILALSRNSINRLTRLINNTLDLQKLNSGTVSLDIHSYNINNLVQEIKSSMIRWTNEKNIYFNLHLDEPMPLIPFDRDKIIQVLVNLVSNAVKFTDKGGITISTASLKNEVVVSVKDKGIGIEEKDISTLFVPFHQLGNAKNRKERSSGLGLSISKTIVEAHGGKIWAESKENEGSVFSFALPLKPGKI